MSYDSNNVFAKILRKEIPCKAIFENEHALSFYDIAPDAQIHALVIPKGSYINAHDFYHNASAVELVEFHKAISRVIAILGLEEPGYRLIANTGTSANQQVPHYHVHILGGNDVSPLINGFEKKHL